MVSSLPQDELPDGCKVLFGKVVQVQSTHVVGSLERRITIRPYEAASICEHMNVPIQYLFVVERGTDKEYTFVDVGSTPIRLGDARIVFEPCKNGFVSPLTLVELYNSSYHNYSRQKDICVDGIVREFEHAIQIGRGS